MSVMESTSDDGTGPLMSASMSVAQDAMMNKTVHRLSGKTALVIGGASGIGKDISVQFAREGARVVVLDEARRARDGPNVVELMKEARKSAGLDSSEMDNDTTSDTATTTTNTAIDKDVILLKFKETMKRLSGNCGECLNNKYFHYVHGDVSDSRMIDAAIKAATSMTNEGRLDILVNNAARLSDAYNLLETAESEWDSSMTVNVQGAFLCTQAAVRQFLKQDPRQSSDGVRGKIINITSQHGKVARKNISYGCSKAALDYMTKQVATDYVEHGIIVNAVAPGRVLTGGSDFENSLNEISNEKDGGQSSSIRKSLIDWTPNSTLGRLGLRLGLRLGIPNDVAKAVSFLASDDASFIIGETLVVDGGYAA